MKARNHTAAIALILLLPTGLAPWRLSASSHREAPAITLDPTADNTDVYAFVSYEPGRQDWVTLIANFIPLETPYGGPNFHKFDPGARYQILIDNDGDAIEDITYEFRFRTETGNSNTFLNTTGAIADLSDPAYNVRQLYSVVRYDGPRSRAVPRETLGADLVTAPPNVGPAATPNYPALADQAIHELGDGSRVFAGPRDEGFYVDLGAIFDLLQIGASPPVDRTAGLNVHSIAIEVPIARLTNNGTRPTDPDDPAAVIGVWSTSSRSTFSALPAGGGSPVGFSAFGFETRTQVSRLGNPLVNEVVIPLARKDAFNASHPFRDVQFLDFVLDPEPARLLNALFGVPVPSAPRTDLFEVFLTGIAGLNQPPDVVPSEQMRLNVAIAPTPASQQDRMGVLGGDLAGHPNGRRVGDDTVDIALQVVAGLLVDGTGAGLGDGVDGNDVPYLERFPYLGTPHPGRIPPPPPPLYTYDCATCPANWFSLASDNTVCAAGTSQSPIALSTGDALQEELPELQFAYPALDIEVEHLRTTVEAIVEGASLELDGVEWDVVQFHFHAPSEHFVDGQETPAEMHIVHRNGDDLLVVGVFIVEGEVNLPLAPIFDMLPQNPGDHVEIDHFDLAAILPDSHESYRYQGSLTTPPCREGVNWVLLAEPIEMSNGQIGALEALFSPTTGFPDGNRRPVQSLNDRVVVTDVP